ncbi:MAG: 50S ribosomal protein L31e [Candidatus Altiarchaeota archaeon]|nr:50S ribosomal protein L31e [Candidatus Altiarchaeota archaeon]
MAKKKEKKKDEVKEKVYNIPLGDAYNKHTTKRGIKAVKMVRDFLKRHTKKDDVKINPAINEFIWAQGRPKPPRSIKVKAVIEGDKVTADLAE